MSELGQTRGPVGPATDAEIVDVHQHVWPEPFLEALRARTHAPRLQGWRLFTEGEQPYDLDPRDHDADRRAELDSGRQIVLSMSTPIGVEALPPAEAAPLLNAWHDGALALGEPYLVWASACTLEPDVDDLAALLARPGIAGLQVPATMLSTPQAVDSSTPLLALAEAAGKPVFVHPGPVHPTEGAPAWWPAVVNYPAQLQAAFWAWRAAGRANLPGLRICFVAGAGLAPSHHERFVARSGERFVIDPDVFVDTSSYRRQGVDTLVRAIGIDTVVLGSDRPYAEPVDPHLGEAAWRAIAVSNPLRLLGTGPRQARGPRPR